MLRSYLTSTFRRLTRNRAYTIINILGLAIGMACAILIYLYVDFEYSWDRFRPNADRVYRVLRKGPTPYGPIPKPFEGLSGAVGPALVEQYPEVEATCRFRIGHRWAKVGDFALRSAFWYADANTLDFFGFKLARGDQATALEVPNGVILNPAIVRTFFGDEDPIGKTIEGQDGDFVVTGILEPMPKNSMLDFNFLTATIPARIRRSASWDDFSRGPRQRQTVTFIRLREGASARDLERKLPAFARTVLPESDRQQQSYLLQGFLRMRMHKNVDFPGGIDGLASGMGSGNLGYVQTLMMIGAAVLLIACINFMNLATAQSTKRAKEVGIRKSVGAARGQIATQFFGESLLLSLISLPVAWTLIQIVQPSWNDFIGQTTELDLLGRPDVFVGIAVIVAGIGLISGTYPALYLSGFRPSLILRGLNAADSTGGIRKALVVLQFGISIVLVIGSLVAWSQLTYLSQKDLGFDRENIITLSFFDVDGRLRRDYREIKARLANHPDVLGVTASASRPGEGWTRDRRQYASTDDPNMTFELSNYSVDEDYFETLGIGMVAGRGFSAEIATDQGDAYILNQTAVEKLGLQDPIGQPFTWSKGKVVSGYGRADTKTGFVIGVVEDFHARSLKDPITPTAYVLDPSRFRIISVKTRTGRLMSTMDHLKEIWSQYITNRPLHHFFLDDRLERAYRNDRRYQNILTVSFGLAIFIACLGLVGLAAYTAERRTKEIGIRKALGASVPGIIRLLSGEFVKTIAIANVVAWPIAWQMMTDWLARFAYHIELSVLPFLGAAVLSLTFALVTVGYQAWRAAQTDPIDALRYE